MTLADFISMDVETGEFGALRGLDIERCAPKLLFIEIAHKKDVFADSVSHGQARASRVFAKAAFLWTLFRRTRWQARAQ